MKSYRLPHKTREAGQRALDAVESSVIAVACSLSVQATERAFCGSVIHQGTGDAITRWLADNGYLTEDDLPELRWGGNAPGHITPGKRNVMPRGRARNRGRK